MREDIKDFLFTIMLLVAMGIVIIILSYAIIMPLWYFSAKNEAPLYNQKFGTHYTVSQFFWAGDTIKEFLNRGKQTVQNIKIEGGIPVRCSE